EGSQKYLNTQQIELKFYTTFLKAVACSGDQSTQEAQNECFDFQNIDRQVGTHILQTKELTPPKNWQRNPHLEPVIEQVTRSFQRMNDLLPGANEPSLLPLDTRIKVGILGLILGIIALSLYRSARLPTSGGRKCSGALLSAARSL